MEKREIRRKVKNLKSMLSIDDKIEAARAVFDAVEKSPAFLLAERILMYHSLPDEVSTHEFLQKWHTKKRFFLPRVNGVNLDILPYDDTRLELGAFHIEEPTGDELTPIDEIELIIVPGVAFDRQGNRLGRGKGFYDRLLAGSRASKIGVAYDFQIVEEIPAEPHDVKMDIVITNNGMHIIK